MIAHKFLLADDYPIMAYGLSTLIKSHLKTAVLDIAGSFSECVAKLKKDNYHCLIVSLRINNPSQIKATTDLIHRFKETPVLIFSDDAADLPTAQLYQAGVRGILDKRTSIEEVVKAIGQVCKGLTYAKAPFLKKVFVPFKNEDDAFDILTSKEKIIVELLIDGDNNKTISEKLTLHQSTVSTFKRHIFKKLNVRNLIELEKLGRKTLHD